MLHRSQQALFSHADIVPQFSHTSCPSPVPSLNKGASSIKHIVIFQTATLSQPSELLSELVILGPTSRSDGLHLPHVLGELFGQPFAELLFGRHHLFLHDRTMLLFPAGSFQALPRESTQQEIDHHVAERFQIILWRLCCHLQSVYLMDASVSPLTLSLVSSNAGEPRSADQA